MSLGFLTLLFTDTIGEIGGTFDSIFGSDVFLGVFVFLFFFIFTLLLGLGMLVGSVVLIPSMFIVFKWIPSVKIVVAILLGLIFGMALNKLIRR